MVSAYNKPMMPYDVAFTEGMSRLDRAKSAAEGRPVDYARRGGAALIERGDMYPAMYRQAMRMSANQRSAEQGRELAWAEAAARKKALADRMTAESIGSLVSGVGGLGMDFLRRGVKTQQRMGPGASPEDVMGEMHRGPYWWETPGSTGGF